MPPKKRAAAGKRALSPVPESDTASPSRGTRSRAKRARFASLSPESRDELDINKEAERTSKEFEREFGEWLSEEPPPSPLTAAREASKEAYKRGATLCYGPSGDLKAATVNRQNEAYRRRMVGCGSVSEDDIPPTAIRNQREEAVKRGIIGCTPEDHMLPPTAARNKQKEAYKPRKVITCPGPVWSTATINQWENRAWQATKKDLTHDETLDWYMDAALKEVKGILRLVSEGKLRQSDLWNLLTFGQHMYAGIKKFYDIDLNDALLDKERDNMGSGLELGPAQLPWPRPAPKRCVSCSRVRTTYLTSEHPWNRTSFGRLYPQEDRYEPGGLFGSEILNPATAYDPFNIPMRMGTTHRGWDV